MAITDNTRGELRALRDQVNQLMEDRVTPAFNDASKYAQNAASRARDYTSDQADMVSEHVRDQPLIAIGIAAAVGFLFGRITK